MEITKIKLDKDDIRKIKGIVRDLEREYVFNFGSIEFEIKACELEDKSIYKAYNAQGNEIEIENIDELIEVLNK